VDSVQALAFGRLDAPGDPAPLAAGRLVVGPTEIAELLSDPRFPGRGMLDLVSSGGR
jgi:hypothetical protein